MKFLTIFTAMFAALGLAASAETGPGQFAIELMVEENGAAIAQERMVVYTGKEYTINLASSYKLSVEVATDTAAAAKQALERDLGQLAEKFIFVNAALTMNIETPKDGIQRKEVISSGMLVPIQYDKEIRAAANLLDNSLKASNGKALGELAFTVKAKPFVN